MMTLPKSRWIVLLALGASVFALASKQGKEEDKKKEEEPKDLNRLFYENFDELEAGGIPGKYFAVDGKWGIAEKDGGKTLELSPAPLVEASVQFGNSLQGGATITALISAAQKRHSFPRYGVALHGSSGFRLRVVPARRIVELARNDEQVAQAGFVVPGHAAVRLKLRAEKKDETRWIISGWAWPDGGKEPSKPQVIFTAADTRLSGKGSVTGTPYAGLPIHYDEIEIRRFPEVFIEK